MSPTDPITGPPSEDTCAPLAITSIENFVDRQEASRQWTLKGLAPETVEVSRDAAKRSGMKLNAWVSRALEQAAMGNSGGSVREANASAPRVEGETIQHIKEELVRLRAQSEDMRKTMDTMSSILLKLCAERI